MMSSVASVSYTHLDELWLVARNEKALTDVAGELDTPSRAVAADLTSEAVIANSRATLSA